MRLAAVAGLLGGMFGFLLSWAGLTDPDVIRRALLLEDAYLYLLMFSAMATAFVGSRLLRRARTMSLLTGEPVAWSSEPPGRRHVVGSVLFGAGWAVASSCPGPIAAQLGQGIFWSLFTIAGVGIGIELYLRQQARAAPEAVPQPAQAPL